MCTSSRILAVFCQVLFVVTFCSCSTASLEPGYELVAPSLELHPVRAKRRASTFLPSRAPAPPCTRDPLGSDDDPEDIDDDILGPTRTKPCTPQKPTTPLDEVEEFVTRPPWPVTQRPRWTKTTEPTEETDEPTTKKKKMTTEATTQGRRRTPSTTEDPEDGDVPSTATKSTRTTRTTSRTTPWWRRPTTASDDEEDEDADKEILTTTRKPTTKRKRSTRTTTPATTESEEDEEETTTQRTSTKRRRSTRTTTPAPSIVDGDEEPESVASISPTRTQTCPNNKMMKLINEQTFVQTSIVSNRDETSTLKAYSTKWFRNWFMPDPDERKDYLTSAITYPQFAGVVERVDTVTFQVSRRIFETEYKLKRLDNGQVYRHKTEKRSIECVDISDYQKRKG